MYLEGSRAGPPFRAFFDSIAQSAKETTMITSKKTLDRKLLTAAAAFLLLAGGASAAIAQEGGGTSMGGMDHGGMGRGMGGMDRGSSGSGGGDHGGMGHGMGGMGHGGGGMMGHEMGEMDHGAMGRGGGMMMGHMMCRASEHVEGRLAYLKAELKLTEAQTPQWNAFADAFRASSQKTAHHCATLREQAEKGGGPTGFVAQLGVMERNMTAHLEAVRALKAAAEPLFAALSEEQKKTADEVLKGPMGMGMGMGKM
jgi:hypothetical protein